MKGGRGLSPEAVLIQKRSAWVRNPGGFEAKGSGLGDSDITEEFDKLVPIGEGDNTAHDM